MSETYHLEELLTEIYSNYYSVSIKGLGDVTRIEIKFKEPSKFIEVRAERIGELANIAVFYREPEGYVFSGSLIKADYAVIFSAFIATIKMIEKEGLQMSEPAK